MISSRVLDWSWWSRTVSITWLESAMPSSSIGMRRASSSAGIYCPGDPPRRKPGESPPMARLHHHAPDFGLPQLVRSLPSTAPGGVPRLPGDHGLPDVLHLDNGCGAGAGCRLA